MVIIFILILVLIFLFLLDKSLEKFISLSMLKNYIPEVICPKYNFEKENKDIEYELVELNKKKLRDVDELMFRSKEGETIYEYNSVSPF
jgi:hypothetical protein